MILPLVSRFHSISFPSEWGVTVAPDVLEVIKQAVSIQLVSPASGELLVDSLFVFCRLSDMFPFN